MHACIAAFSTGVAVVPLAYSRKFNGLFESLGYSVIADGKAMCNEEAFATVTNGYIARASLSRQVGSALQLAERQLKTYQKFIQDFISKKDN
jgi:polysaccharide pyruvyl transferase WcaK-like protein